MAGSPQGFLNQGDRDKLVHPFCRTDSARYLQAFQASAGTFAINMRVIWWQAASVRSPQGLLAAAESLRWRCPVTSIMGLAYVHRNKPDSSNALSDNSRRGKMRRFLAVDTELPDNQEDRSSIQCAYIEICQYTHNALATRAQHPAHMQWTCPSLRRGFGSLFARVSGICAVISRYLQIVLFADDSLSTKTARIQ